MSTIDIAQFLLIAFLFLGLVVAFTTNLDDIIGNDPEKLMRHRQRNRRGRSK